MKRLLKMLRNVLLDLRHGGLLGRTIPTRYAHLGAIDTASTDYAVLPHVFGDTVGRDDVVVDVGCGRGRVLMWLAHRKIGRRLVGVELDPEVAAYVAKKTRRLANVEIVSGNVLERMPADATVFYLYNPFHREVVAAFRDRVAETYAGRGVTILYYNPKNLDVFRADPRWEVTVRDLSRLPSAQGDLGIIRLRTAVPAPDSRPA
jgi:SAM-dependent methyltransferase